jgi:predicted nucleic acid-binding protein
VTIDADADAVLRANPQEQLLTTNHVRGETWTYLRRRSGHAAAVDFLDSLAASPRLVLVTVADTDEADAIAWLRRHDERSYSWVDATSFATM